MELEEYGRLTLYMEQFCYWGLMARTTGHSHAYLWAVSIQEMFSEWWINKALLHGLTNSTGQIMLLPPAPTKTNMQTSQHRNRTVSNEDAALLTPENRSDFTAEQNHWIHRGTEGFKGQQRHWHCVFSQDVWWHVGQWKPLYHIHTFAFINLTHCTDMGKKTTYIWLVPTNFTN